MQAMSGPAWMDRAAWPILGVAGVVSAVLILYLNRGTIFFVDELVWFGDLASYTDPGSVLVPHNSHLHGTTRVVYFAVMELFGTDYAVVRVLGAVVVPLCALLFFAYARRRVGTVAALVPAILLLFYGTGWQHVAVPIGFTVLGSIAAGLACLLALDGGDRRGDALACALLCLSVFTFTIGIAFLVGVAISVFLRPDRLRRAWIFLVPLLLYSAWWIWAQKFGQGRTELANLENVVPFVGESLAVITGALSGVNAPFASVWGDAEGGITVPASALGWIVAALFVAALAWRIGRGDVPRSLWASLGILGTYWLAAVLSESSLFPSEPEAFRYMYPGTIGVLLVAVDAATGLRPGRRATAALLAVGAFSLAMNVVVLSEGAGYFRDDYSPQQSSSLAMLELAAGLRPGPVAEAAPPSTEALGSGVPLAAGPDRDEYLEATELYGSPAYTLEEVRAAPPVARRVADFGLVEAHGVRLGPSEGPDDERECDLLEAGSEFTGVGPEGTYLRPVGGEPVPLLVARFSDVPEVALPPGPLPSGRWSELAVPEDGAPEAWRLGSGTGAVRVCPAS